MVNLERNRRAFFFSYQWIEFLFQIIAKCMSLNLTTFILFKDNLLQVILYGLKAVCDFCIYALVSVYCLKK